MLLKSIKLENFRQFRNESIDFAQGENGKNVTIIIGENGTGKTTFAQAFFWCMYGETEFSDKVILNRIVANGLRTGESAKVSVRLEIVHGENYYTLIRDQVYQKDGAGNLKANNTILDIQRRDKTGNTVTILPSDKDIEIKSILPKELSRYFFFDGERIERMSKDISNHKKANDFAEAVRSLLGLKGMESAIGHLRNPRSKQTVIGYYENSYDASSNSEIQRLGREIDQSKERIAAIDQRIEELERQIELAEDRKRIKEEELKQYADGEKWQREREELQKKIASAKATRDSLIKNICDDFYGGIESLLSIWMIYRAMRMLKEQDLSGKDIPHMHCDTIAYLLKQRVCICGTHLDEGTVPYEKVKSLMNYLPPKSLASTIGDFKTAARSQIRDAQNTRLMEKLGDHMAVISQQTDDIENYEGRLADVEAHLNGEDVESIVRAINLEIQTCVSTIRKCKTERDNIILEKGALEHKWKYAESQRSQLALLDDKNRRIEIYKAYAEQVYNELFAFYKKSESATRDKLQKTINEIFKQIYEGGLSLTIDEQYHISVYANDYAGDVETSTAQSISVIFAFIAGIIKLARENRNATDEDAKLLTSEPYPLVMDAPLSSFDKRRIKTVCNALPEVAEQVVVFIKDTDGDLAEQYMGDRIGSKHRFDKLNEFETKLV